MRCRLGMTIAVTLFTAVAQADAQQSQTPNRFPLAAPAGGDSKARQVAPPGAVNQGPFDATTWKYGNAFAPPPGAKIWNPAKIKLMQEGAKLVGGTVSSGIDPSTYCAMANAGYDFHLDRDAARQHHLGPSQQGVAHLPPCQGGSRRARSLCGRIPDPACARRRRPGDRGADRRQRRGGDCGQGLDLFSPAWQTQSRRRRRV